MSVNTAESENAQPVAHKPASELIYRLEDRPPLPQTLFAAFQHLLAMFVAVITPALLICQALGLPAQDTQHIISMSLFASGVASIIQIKAWGPVGSGLLSIQGTSFNFVAPLIMGGTALKTGGADVPTVQAALDRLHCAADFDTAIQTDPLGGFVRRTTLGGLAEMLGAKAGGNLVLFTSTLAGQTNALDMDVAQIWDTGVEATNDKALRLPLGFVQKLLDTDGATRVAVLLTEATISSLYLAFFLLAVRELVGAYVYILRGSGAVRRRAEHASRLIEVVFSLFNLANGVLWLALMFVFLKDKQVGSSLQPD